MHFVTLLALAAFFSGAALRVCDGLIPRLSQDFHLSTGQAGSAVIVFAVAYGLMQLAFGPLADRFGKARMVTLAVGGCAVLAFAAFVRVQHGGWTFEAFHGRHVKGDPLANFFTDPLTP
ncbi:MAG: MFS transporter, partial [Burkholderiales bacterium]